MGMNWRPFVFAATATFALASATTLVQAQEPSPAPSAQGSASANTPNSPSTPTAPQEKKVWTNDDLEKLHGRPDIGEFNGPKAKGPERPRWNSSQYSNAGYAGWYRGQLENLRRQLASIDQQISQYRNALDGKQVSTATFGRYYMKGTDWEAELKRLEKQRADVQKQIDDVEDQARKNNVSPGDIR